MIEAIIKTLNSIKVSGKEDMEKLLGVIYALEDLRKKLDTPKGEPDGEQID